MAVLANPRHEAFARNLAQGMTQEAAYEAAGYEVKSEAGARASASRLLTNANIQARLAELQERAATGTVTTVETLLEAAWGIINDARKAEDFSAASQTIERAAKIAGLWVDKSKQDHTISAHEDALRELE